MKASCQLTSVAALECGIYALAMAMATEPEVTRHLDWSSGTLEKRYYDALQDLHSQYLGFDNEDYVLGNGDLFDIIECWGRRYKDTYGLYIDDRDNIRLENTGTKVILLRCFKDRWQACCYFEEENGSVNTSPVDLSADQPPAPQSSVDSINNQLRDSTAPKTWKNLDDTANEINNTAAVDSTTAKLVSTLQKLVTGVERLTLVVETRNAYDKKNLRAVVNGLKVLLDRAPLTAHAKVECDLNKATNESASEADTEYDIALNTPSTMQAARKTESPSEFDACDNLAASTSRSDVTKNESELTAKRALFSTLFLPRKSDFTAS